MKMEKGEFYSEDVKGIYSRRPPWFESWGLSFFLLLIFTTVIACYFVKYPIELVGEVELVDSSIETLVSRKPGFVILRSEGNQMVKEGDTLGYIHTSLFKELDIIFLKKKLEALRILILKEMDFSQKMEAIDEYLLPTTTGITQFDKAYLEIEQGFQKSAIIGKYQFLMKSIDFLKEQRLLNVQLLDEKRSSIPLNKQILDIQKWEFHTDSILFEAEVISNKDFSTGQSEFLSHKKNYRRSLIELKNDSIELFSLNSQIEAKLWELKNFKFSTLRTLNDELLKLENLMVDWAEVSCFIAPTDGKVVINESVIQDRSFIDVNKPVFLILGKNNNIFEAFLKIRPNNAGKLDSTDRVLVDFYDYPYPSYDYVEAKIISVPELFFEDHYTIKLRIYKEGGEGLNLREGMKGRGFVTVEKRRLLHYFLDQFF